MNLKMLVRSVFQLEMEVENWIAAEKKRSKSALAQEVDFTSDEE
jgi:hypothetical protein